MVRREFYLTDDAFADGICNLVSEESTGILLTSGKGDGVDATLEVYPNYQKGDPFTYDDFTPEQLAKLRGADGDSPQIGANGNWFVGAKDTGIRAQGEKGESGTTELMGFEIKDGDLYVSIPEDSNIEFNINNSGELVAVWEQ